MRSLVVGDDGRLVSPSPSSPHFDFEQSQPGDSDMVVILSSLLCALISVVGLALVARCACRRQAQSRTTSNTTNPPCPPPARGLKKKSIEALPTVTFVQGGRREEEEGCVICLAELMEGEELRVLPRCNHAFHKACIDAWLGAHASCPSCRAAAIMVPCRSCDLDLEHADGTC